MPAPARRRDPEGRRSTLLDAAARVFAEKGIARATVSDIVKAAGVAQGTFYLYFPSKDALLDALIDQTIEALMGAIDSATSSGTAVGKLLAIRDILTAEVSAPELRPLVEFMHHPSNEAAHHRMAERVVDRLEAVMEGVVVQGVAEGSFRVEDPRVAAWFVLLGMQSIERVTGTTAQTAAAFAQVTEMALRALGYRDE